MFTGDGDGEVGLVEGRSGTGGYTATVPVRTPATRPLPPHEVAEDGPYTRSHARARTSADGEVRVRTSDE